MVFRYASPVMKSIGIAALVIQMSFLAACNPQARGFALPEGNADAGRETFVRLQCNGCHSVNGDLQKLPDGDAEIHYALGGDVTRVKTYGDLVTSVINPSHRISRGLRPENVDDFGNSKMRLYNEVMTIQELIDITAYLQPKYQVIVPTQGYYYHGP